VHQLSQSNDLRAFIPIDVPAPMSFADYSAGRDPAVDPILAGAEMRSIPTIALQDGGAAARKAWHERAARYAKIDWFEPPEEFALRQVMDTLISEGRAQDALETAKLNTEIHPYVWNTWYNLASAQKAAGEPEQRYASYECVVLLEPNNWNVPSIRELFARDKVDPQPAPGCPAGE
jgi:hypothetical protein